MISIYMTNPIVVLINTLFLFRYFFQHTEINYYYFFKNSFEFSHLLIIMYMNYLCKYFFQLVIVFRFLSDVGYCIYFILKLDF